MTRFITKLALAGATLALTAAPIWAQTIKWDLPNEYQASSIHAEGDAFFAKRLKELSGGKIEITLHMGGALGYKSKDQFDAVSDGALPLADSYTGAWQGIDPIFTMPALPFLAVTLEEVKALYAVAKPYYDEVFRKNNQRLLWASPWPPSGLWGKKPLDGMDALKNVRIRTYDPNGTMTLKAAGAAPIQLSWADVIPQLTTGGIDGVLTSAEGGVAAKMWEQLKFFTEINYASPLNFGHINVKVYEGLAPDLKKAVDQAAKDTEDRNWKAWVQRVEENYRDMRANGMTVVTSVPKAYLDALSKAGEAALKDWSSKMGSKGDTILADYRKRVGRS